MLLCGYCITGVPEAEISLGKDQLADHVAIGAGHEAAAVEHQLIVTADLVHVHHRALQPAGRGGCQLTPQLGLACAKG